MESQLKPVSPRMRLLVALHASLVLVNTGCLNKWELTGMKRRLGENLPATLRQRCFIEKQLSDGQDNPLWRPVVMRDGLLVRRTLCQG